MTRTILAAAGLAAIASVAVAQMPAGKPGAPDPARVTGGAYTADPQHTLVGWRVDHLGISDYFGLFGQVTGTLVIDRADPARSRVDVTIPIDPIVASPQLREHLLRPGKDGKKPDFFGPDPAAARFVSKTVTPGADGRSAYIVGDLTLNGRTRPVAIQATFKGAGTMMGKEQVGFSGRAMLRRSDFGLTTALPMVPDEVELDLSAAFMKNAEPQESPPLGANACNADKAQPWIGKTATPAVRAEIAKATGAKTIRWITPGMAVTADYRPDRLNVSMKTMNGTILKAGCG